VARDARSRWRILAAATALAALAGAAPAHAHPYQLRNLSSLVGDEREPRVSAGRVVWQVGSGSTAEVRLWDGIRVWNLTTDGFADEHPEIDGDTVVWQKFDGVDYEIAVYDVLTGTTSFPTNNGYDDILPRISGGRYAWQANAPPGIDLEIFVNPGDTRVTGNGKDDFDHQVDGEDVVYVGTDPMGSDLEIFLWHDVDPGRGLYQLSSDTVDDHAPQVSEGRVVWQAGDGAAAEIVRYDPNAAIPVLPLTTDGVEDKEPDVSGPVIVWSRDDGNDFEIFMRVGDGPNVQITTNGYDDHSPRVSGEDVVWVADEPGGSQIWVCLACASGGTPERLTQNAFTNRAPRIDGDSITWEACTNAGTPSEKCDVWLAPEPASGGALAALLALAGVARARGRSRRA
jgi:hypothetical protein